MAIVYDLFSAVGGGTFKEFKKFYQGEINQVNKYSKLNLLQMAFTNDEQPEEKMKIIEFLLRKGIDINYQDKKDQQNALHIFYFCVWRPTVEYENKITNLLIEHGINVNQMDKYNATPLMYAITLNKLTTMENKQMYQTLLTAGSDYNLKDKFGKSTLDYAKEYFWRNDFIEIVDEFEKQK